MTAPQPTDHFNFGVVKARKHASPLSTSNLPPTSPDLERVPRHRCRRPLKLRGKSILFPSSAAAAAAAAAFLATAATPGVPVPHRDSAPSYGRWNIAGLGLSDQSDKTSDSSGVGIWGLIGHREAKHRTSWFHCRPHFSLIVSISTHDRTIVESQ